MEYIRTIELGELLKIYNVITTMIESLSLQLKEISSISEDELIESLTFKRKIDGLPFRKGTSDRTGRIALSINSEVRGDMQEICRDMIFLSNVLEKLRISLTALCEIEKEVIIKKYFEGCTWQQSAKHIGKDIRTIKRYRDNSLKKMVIIARITLGDYQKLQKLFDLR